MSHKCITRSAEIASLEYKIYTAQESIRIIRDGGPRNPEYFHSTLRNIGDSCAKLFYEGKTIKLIESLENFIVISTARLEILKKETCC